MANVRFVDPEPLTSDGAVEKVWDTLHERPRVRRRLWNLPRSEWEEARERFRDLAQLSARALPRLVAVGEEDRVLTLVEDHIAGQTLEERLAGDDPPDLVASVKILVPVVQAVGAMHELFLGHGGIDTRSIVVDDDGVGHLVGAGAREALPDMDFDALSEVMVRAFEQPTDETSALIRDLRQGKLRDCARVAERLLELVPDGGSELGDIDDTFGYAEPLEAPVEEESEGDDAYDFGGWPGVDDLERQRRDDDRRMLRWFSMGTAAIALIGLAAAVDLDGADAPPDEASAPEGPVDFASIHDDAWTGPEDDDEARRVDGLGKWRVQREEGGRHPATVITLEAENIVRDRLNRSGRPALHIRCEDERIGIAISPGVDTVEAFVAEDATYARHANLSFTWEGSPTEQVQADFRVDSSDLDLRALEPLLDDAPRAESLYLSYTPFASPAVVAIFDVRGMDRALAALTRFCPLP